MSITTISPFRAILLCINSMIAAGLFINPKPLTLMAGEFGFLGYAISAIILYPLILCVAELTRLHPVAGGLYVYSKIYLGSWAGFIAGWSYFIGKTTTVAVLMHRFVCFIQPHIPVVATLPTLIVDFALISFFVLLNIRGISVGGKIQYVFAALKGIPLIFSFAIGALYFDTGHFFGEFDYVGVLGTIPIAVFALLGFEVICSIANMIEDAKNNTSRVILTSFYIVATVDILFQLAAYGVLGTGLIDITEPILRIASTAFGASVIGSLLNAAVFTSILGGFFSLLTSNCWNLATISKAGHLPFKKILSYTNNNNVPVFSLIIEAALAVVILSITVNQVPLQNMSVFAQIICYSLTAGAALIAVLEGATKKISKLTPFLAVASCCLIMGISLHRIIQSGVSTPFLIIYGAGYALAISKILLKKKTSGDHA